MTTDPKLLKALSEAMIREMEYKRQNSILRDALEYYASASCYRAKRALSLVDQKIDSAHTSYPPAFIGPPSDEL